METDEFALDKFIKIGKDKIPYRRYFEKIKDSRYIKKCSICEEMFEIGEEVIRIGYPNRYGGSSKLCYHIPCILKILKMCDVHWADDFAWKKAIGNAIAVYESNVGSHQQKTNTPQITN